MSHSNHHREFSNLVEMLRERARLNPEGRLFTFLADGEKRGDDLSYGELDRRARIIAAYLQDRGMKGERAILLYAPGLEYIAGFFGCLYAGVIAVPAYPPDPNRLERTLPRLQSIVRDCQAKVILTTEMIRSLGKLFIDQAPDLGNLDWVATDTLPAAAAESWLDPAVTAQSLAFLQYTSGSTGDPKGVMLSHENLLHNMDAVHRAFNVSKGTSSVLWLPPYHDMGLIGGILGTVYNRVYTVLMSPLHFLQKPLRWLEAISRNGATVSGGPNFAYELCARKATPEQVEALDLSCWELAFCGAEPIASETLDRFAKTFEPCGFRREAFYPCYGLAEGTLIVSGGISGEGPKLFDVSKEELKRLKALGRSNGKAYLSLVGCGRSIPGQRLAIVRPDTLEECGPGEVGEIWVRGPSVAQGYWNQEKRSQETFGAVLAGSKEGPFLRTGDLGFLRDDELFVTSRLKDLIIIRGTNHYPQDIEKTVEESHEAFRPGCSAAFSVMDGYEEKLIIAQEVDLSKVDDVGGKFDPLLRLIRKNVAAYHDLEVSGILLLRKGVIPKTSSGKVQRHKCREEFLAGSMEVLASYRTSQKKQQVRVGKEEARRGPSTQEMDIKNWLIQAVSDHLGVEPRDIDPAQPLAEYGLDSRDAVTLSGEMEDYLGCVLSPTILWKYPTIDGLAQYLAGEELQELNRELSYP